MMGGWLGWEQDMAQQSSGGTRIQVRENGQYKIIPSPIHTRTHQQRNTTRTSCETLSREKDAESRSRETITHPIHPRFKQKSKNWTNPQKKNSAIASQRLRCSVHTVIHTATNTLEECEHNAEPHHELSRFWMDEKIETFPSPPSQHRETPTHPDSAYADDGSCFLVCENWKMENFIVFSRFVVKLLKVDYKSMGSS